MHGAGRFHRAIVCQRVAATSCVSVLALALGAALLAGCGGQSTSAQPNGEAAKPAARVLADADTAARSARSAHVSGSLESNGAPLTLDLTTVRGKGAKGSASRQGLEFDVIRIGDTIYIRGSDAFLKHFAGPTVAQLLHGRWLEASATHGRLRAVAPLTSIDALFAGIRSHHGKLVNEGRTTYGGRKVVAIRDSSDGSKLYVAALGTPYPVAIVGGKKGLSGTIRFGDWNQPVSLSAPKGAIDLSELGG